MESLLTEICDTTSIAEFELKVSVVISSTFSLEVLSVNFTRALIDIDLILSQLLNKFHLFLECLSYLNIPPSSLLAWWISAICDKRLDWEK